MLGSIEVRLKSQSEGATGRESFQEAETSELRRKGWTETRQGKESERNSAGVSTENHSWRGGRARFGHRAFLATMRGVGRERIQCGPEKGLGLQVV